MRTARESSVPPKVALLHASDAPDMSWDAVGDEAEEDGGSLSRLPITTIERDEIYMVTVPEDSELGFVEIRTVDNKVVAVAVPAGLSAGDGERASERAPSL